MAGIGEEEFFYQRVEQLQIKDFVEVLGLVQSQAVEHLMRESDLVLVTSRHEYLEGFALTIEHALRNRTPILASDRPMFKTHGSRPSSVGECGIIDLDSIEPMQPETI